METTTKINKTENWFQKQIAQFKESRFGAMTILITIQSCLGSIAASYTLKEDEILVGTICTAVTMASNAAFISQVSGKWCLGIFYAGVLINVGIIISQLF